MDDRFQKMREREFSRLDDAGHVYLDFTGAGLHAESQVRAHMELLRESVLGNPHSRNPTSLASTRIVEVARERVTRFFEADPEEYEVVFTPNATGALKLVGESFPFQPGSHFVLTADNHNSVLGIREFARAHGAEVVYVPIGRGLRIADIEPHLAGADPAMPNLFVYPAQSNFSGVKHPLEWVDVARAMGYNVFLDAAALAPTSPLRLRDCAPDFVCIAFYKMFGFPTGVGALLARREALARLHRPWFGGGTVRFVSARSEVQLLHSTGRGFEDGTPNYLGIAAVVAGLDFLDGIGMPRIQRHVMGLMERLLDGLRGLRHPNGTPMIRIYGPETMEDRGATVAFNVLDARGQMVDFREVEARASEAGISLRTGYFCNPGAAEFALEHADEEIQRCFHMLPPDAFSIQQLSACMNDKPVGAVRVSLGLPSNEADIDRLLEVLAGISSSRTIVGAEQSAGERI